MKKKYLQYAIYLFVIFTFAYLYGCSSTQSSYYKPKNGGTGWKVDVIKKGGIPDEFICTINDSTVMKASFPFIGDSFEKSGQYRGKNVKMNGYKKSTSTKDANGNTTTNDSYQIRVFIDDNLVDKFDF